MNLPATLGVEQEARMNFQRLHARQFLRCSIVVLAFGGTVKAEDLLDAPWPEYFRQQMDAIQQQGVRRGLSPNERAQLLQRLQRSYRSRGTTAFSPDALQIPPLPGKLPTFSTRNPFEQPIHLFGHPK